MLLVLVCLLVCSRTSAQSRDLFTAAENGDLPRVSALLAKRIDVNAARENGWTVLMADSSTGHLNTGEDTTGKRG